MRSTIAEKECPVCREKAPFVNGKFYMSTAMDETSYCSLTCERRAEKGGRK